MSSYGSLHSVDTRVKRSTMEFLSVHGILHDAVPLLVAALGSAGLWGYLSTRIKIAHDKAKHEASVVAEYSKSVKEQVECLAAKLDQLTHDKEQLLMEIADLRAELAEANATIKHLQELLRAR